MNFKDFRKYKAYSGYYRNREDVLSSASGGAISAISEAFIRNNGVVFGVKYSNNFRNAEYAIARTMEELDQFKQSKYISAQKTIEVNNEKRTVFECIKKELEQEKTVLFIGLGCDVAALRNYCIQNRIVDNELFAIELICHGPGIQKVHEAYIDYLEERYHSKLVFFTTRYKKTGAFPPYVKAVFENGEAYVEKFSNTDLGKAFYRYVKPGCTKCPFKGMNHKGDIVIGDHLGISEERLKNEEGVSLLVALNEKGKHMVDLLKSDFFVMEEIDPAYAIKCNSMYWKVRAQANDYEDFIKCFDQKGLHDAIKRVPEAVGGTSGQSMKSRIRSLIPPRVIALIRKIFDIV